ncbi:MAG: NAD(P)-dependent oxidoreductase [Castellaniella sp.]|uniref:precorrin-2 dehydrogenase/sirohydrochlorin ferrochelatase family protein n=1 Tax=Castellaniella sp. TaxID=1955812 RepID=UPI002A35ECFB|nr:NAD(P)-dependent oxidoreductase [Castellaniella sp.]MDY0309874.1 NAD(P)-dependent oxidoreductase [Castellaniella sp.]
MPSNVFPLFIRLAGKRVLVVGGGEIAERKIRLLLRSGACITAIARSFTPTLARLGLAGDITLLHGSFESSQLQEVWLVIAATNDPTVNQAVAQACAERHLYVNVVDDAQLSTAHIPAIVDRSPLMIGISSSGSAPMFARAVRERIEALTDPALGPLTRMAQQHRADIAHRFPDLAKRRALYEALLRGPVMPLLHAGRNSDAEQAFLATLDQGNLSQRGQACTILAPADDPGELTLNGLRALNQADTVYHTSCCHPGLLELARRDATRVVFQLSESTTLPDDATLQSMLDVTRHGQSIVTLLPAAAAHGSHRLADFFIRHGIEHFQLPHAAGRHTPTPRPPSQHAPVHPPEQVRFPSTAVTGEA